MYKVYVTLNLGSNNPSCLVKFKHKYVVMGLGKAGDVWQGAITVCYSPLRVIAIC